jgi:carboxylesterase type B
MRSLVLSAALVVALATAADAIAAPESSCVDLSGANGQASGTLCGSQVAGGGAFAYKGIRYATSSRWTSSRPVTGYAKPQAATAFGPVCPQPGVQVSISEDCLYLNVWTPIKGNADRQNLPVMVFIHGGAFVGDSGSNPYYDGTAFARDRNVVVVTLNYRLGAFGFLRTDAKGHPPRNGGNYGFEDQINALQWVRNNIGAFGGDPDRVTLFGESAGAMSVGLHLLASPRSKDLFSAAIQESNPIGYRFRNPKQADKQRAAFFACLNSVMKDASAKDCSKGDARFPGTAPSITQVINAQNLYTEIDYNAQEIDYGLPASIPFAPLVDGRFLTAQPADAVAKGSQKPSMYGFNKDEGVIFAESEGIDTPKELENNLVWLLGRKASKILTIPRYNPEVLSPAYGLPNASATAYANFFTDFEVQCATMAANSRPGTDTSPNVWMYEFTQTAATHYYLPAFDPMGLCAPHNRWNNSCHASELQFVFNTLDDAATEKDRALADTMNKTWASFAKAPDKGPRIEGWDRWGWSVGHPTGAPFELANPKGGVDTRTTFARANCSTWIKLKLGTPRS